METRWDSSKELWMETRSVTPKDDQMVAKIYLGKRKGFLRARVSESGSDVELASLLARG